MLSINSNSNALSTSRHLAAARHRQAESIERLGSGKRINAAKDDAAGLAISSRMTSGVRTLSKLIQGINDGISVTQIAEGALGSITAILQRCREIAVQAANGTLSGSDRQAINAEYLQLRAEIDRIAETTQAFGMFPLKGVARQTTPPVTINTPHITDVFPSSGSSGSFTSGIVPIAFIPSGATDVTITINAIGIDDDIQLFSRDGKHLVGTPVLNPNGDYVWQTRGISTAAAATAQVMTTANGFLGGAAYDESSLLQGGPTYAYPNGATTGSYNGMTFTYSGDWDRYETGAQFNDGSVGANPSESVHIDRTTEDLLVLVVGNGAFSARATWGSMPPRSTLTLPSSSQPADDIRILLDAPVQGSSRYVSIERTPADVRTLGLDAIELDTQSNAGAAIAEIDKALETVGRYRTSYGAVTSRFEGAIGDIAQKSENLSAARSRILDADYAQLSAAMVKDGILADAATAMLTQANTSQKTALELLRQTIERSGV